MLKQLSAQDAQFLYTQTANNLTHIMGVYIYDPSTAPGGFVRFKDIIRHVESRVHTSPLFKRRLHRPWNRPLPGTPKLHSPFRAVEFGGQLFVGQAQR